MPSDSLTIEQHLGPTGTVEEIAMRRKKSVPKREPDVGRVNQILDGINPPRPVVEPVAADPRPEPEAEPVEERPSGVNAQLAKALEIATAECAGLAEKGTALAAELEVAKEQLLTVKARVRELEGVMEHIGRSVSCALPKEAERNGESASSRSDSGAQSPSA